MVALGASACVYRVNIQQGNFLTTETTDQLKEGMTRSQVRFLLGTPMVPDAFDENRWDYLYYLKRGRIQEPERRRLTVWFEDDKVARIEKINVLAPVLVPTTPAPQALPTEDTQRAPAQAPAPEQAPPPTDSATPGG